MCKVSHPLGRKLFKELDLRGFLRRYNTHSSALLGKFLMVARTVMLIRERVDNIYASSLQE